MVRRLMPLRAALLPAALALSACSALTPHPAFSAAAADPVCGPPTATTLASGHRARIYAIGQTVFGCVAHRRRQTRLGAHGLALGRGVVTSVGVAGVYAAYGLERSAVDTTSAVVIVRRLTTGRSALDVPATTAPTGAESTEAVDALVVKRDGAVAWIGAKRSLISRGGAIYEVHAGRRHVVRLLDSGRRIDPTSLRLHRSRLTWIDHGVRRVARLR